MANDFSYKIDYDKAIAQDLAVLAECDRYDRVNALVPVYAAMLPLGWDLHTLMATCSNLEFAQAVADAAGVPLAVFAERIDTDDDTYLALHNAYAAAYGSARMYLVGDDRLAILTPEQTKVLRKQAKASLARHTRNKAKCGS